ncbi:glycosyltransferase [Algoriphagus litoralis]|uniref:glycosyltransferase n=1 Tax=Algoriphagus litoralis TaxID=2202829 RepID=UPI000DB9CE70|nr:glycosyltransferase [Algoriphagus litoralis]
MTKFPLISIGLCTYNGAPYLRQQLDSLVQQTYPSLEIRIRDDQSEDETVAIIKEFQARFPNIHLVQNPVRMGLQKNFEAVFTDCQGEFIAPCDQDDIWLPHKLERIHQAIGMHQIAYHDSLLIDEHGRSLEFRMSDKFRLKSWNRQSAFLLFNCISGHSMLFNKQLLNYALPFPEQGFYDHWLAFVALESGSIKYCPEVLVKYRQHQSNQTDILGNKKQVSGRERVLTRISRENYWLSQCSNFIRNRSDSHPVFRFEKLAKSRERKYFCLDLGLEIWKQRSEILEILPYSLFSQLGFVFRYTLGLKLKTLFYRSR